MEQIALGQLGQSDERPSIKKNVRNKYGISQLKYDIKNSVGA